LNTVSVSVKTFVGRAHVQIRRHPRDGLPFDTFLNLGKLGLDIIVD
jgi:hypothetical protein